MCGVQGVPSSTGRQQLKTKNGKKNQFTGDLCRTKDLYQVKDALILFYVNTCFSGDQTGGDAIMCRNLVPFLLIKT